VRQIVERGGGLRVRSGGLPECLLGAGEIIQGVATVPETNQRTETLRLPLVCDLIGLDGGLPLLRPFQADDRLEQKSAR